MLYLAVLLYIVVLVYFYDFKNNNYYKRIHYNILLVIFVLIAGFRYRMAPDTVAYMDNYKFMMKPLSDLNFVDFSESRYQPFWILINSFCKSFGNYILLQIIAAGIFNICVFVFFMKTSTKVFTCILFYFLVDYFYFNMEIVRESIAIGFFLLAMIRYNQNYLLRCFWLIFVAFLFHHFAAVLFLVPIYLSEKINFKLKFIALTSIILFLLSFDAPLFFINSYLEKFSSVDVSFYELADFKMSVFGYLYMFLKILPVILVMFLYQKRAVPNLFFNKKTLFLLCLLYVFIVIIRATSIPFIERLSNYFIFFVILLLTGAIYDVLDVYVIKFLQFKTILVLSFVCLYFQLMPYLEVNPFFGVPLYKRYYPYYSVFSEKTDADRELMTAMEGKE